MLYPSINVLREKADSRYTIVVLAAKRAREYIEMTSKISKLEERDLDIPSPKLTLVNTEKPVSIAAHEIAEELITYKRL